MYDEVKWIYYTKRRDDMHCKKCGTELREEDKFCYHCGNRTGVLQRIFSSRALIGSMIALLIVALAALLTYFIWTGKLQIPSWGNEKMAEDGSSGGGKRTPSEKTVPPSQTQKPKATATPYVFQPSDVTAAKKAEMKPLTDRLMPFLAYSASFYADGSHAFRWDDASATTMALYNLEHYDKSLKYGDSMEKIKKKTKEEMKKLFGKNYKYKLKYGGSYPDYVYRPVGNTVVFNSTRISGKKYHLKVKKIMEYEEGKYRLTVEAYLSFNGVKGDAQNYTVMVEKEADPASDYVVQKIKLKK